MDPGWGQLLLEMQKSPTGDAAIYYSHPFGDLSIGGYFMYFAYIDKDLN